jgi:hypothetical protein
MSGIIINIPPIIPTPPINPTNDYVPVRQNATSFIDSNIKNVFDNNLTTEIGGNVIGLNFDFGAGEFCFGNPVGTNFCVDDYNGQIEINGVLVTTPIVSPEKLMYIKINGFDYYIQLYKTL